MVVMSIFTKIKLYSLEKMVLSCYALKACIESSVTDYKDVIH